MNVGKRVLVLGCPGSGKSTFALRLRDITGLPLIHLDAVWWRPDRTHITRDEFDERLRHILSGDEWIIEGDYSRTYEARISACDTVFFLDVDEEECLRGIEARRGKPRPDLPWIEDEPDPELIADVRLYREKKRPLLLSLLEKYSEKQVFLFTSRAQADGWLDGLAKETEL